MEALTTLPVLLWTLLTIPYACLLGDVTSQPNSSYDLHHVLYAEKLSSDRYNPEIRPILNQSEVIVATAMFYLLSILKIDDVTQKMVTTSFLKIEWTDQLITWNPADYGGIALLTPNKEHVWRPSLMLVNTLDDMVPINGDSAGHITINPDGLCTWDPGNLLTTFCEMHLAKYPFDVQICSITFSPYLYHTALRFETKVDEINIDGFVPIPGWVLIETSAKALYCGEPSQKDTTSCFQFTLHLKRNPVYFVVNSILPVILLAFLSNFVFLVPVESGEKISYGIVWPQTEWHHILIGLSVKTQRSTTVLLALAVFLSIVSTKLPMTTDGLPAVTVYLLVLMLSSVISVLVSIVIVHLHHRLNKVSETTTRKVHPLEIIQMKPDPDTVISATSVLSEGVNTGDYPKTSPDDKLGNPRWKLSLLMRYVDITCFVIATILWMSSTLTYFAYVQS